MLGAHGSRNAGDSAAFAGTEKIGTARHLAGFLRQLPSRSFGGHGCAGRAGGGAEWRDLVGANPHSPREFIPRLLTKDDGWLASYFDSLSRVPPRQQAHFVDSPRLRQYYEALRGRNASPSATASVFRPDPTLLLLITRMQWEPNGEPHIPGNLQAWKAILQAEGRCRRRAQRQCGNRRAGRTPDGLRGGDVCAVPPVHRRRADRCLSHVQRDRCQAARRNIT